MYYANNSGARLRFEQTKLAFIDGTIAARDITATASPTVNGVGQLIVDNSCLKLVNSYAKRYNKRYTGVTQIAVTVTDGVAYTAGAHNLIPGISLDLLDTNYNHISYQYVHDVVAINSFLIANATGTKPADGNYIIQLRRVTVEEVLRANLASGTKNVRTLPDSSSEFVATLTGPCDFVVLTKYSPDSWYKIIFATANGISTGYVSRSSITVTQEFDI